MQVNHAVLTKGRTGYWRSFVLRREIRTFSGNLKMRSQPKGVEGKITESELKTSKEGLRVS